MNIEPCYDFKQPNEAVLLTTIKSSIRSQEKIYEGQTEVRLDLLPVAGITLYASLPFPFSSVSLMLNTHEIDLAGRPFPGFVTKATPFSQGSFNMVLRPKVEPMIGRGDPNTKMNNVIFHIFNYKDFIGTRRSVEKASGQAIEHADLDTNDWHIELKSLTSTRETFKILKETGGYGLTHVGCLQRKDGLSFDGAKAIELLNAFRFFVSFSKGMWCNPCLAVGFDDKENRVWEAWSSPKGHWDQPSSWFDPHHCEQLGNLFTGFMVKWQNEGWQDALHEAIYLYLNANDSHRGIDVGIIVAQAAIERLCFEYAVKYKRLVEAEGFKKLQASDKFRMLFSSLDIPIDIPASLPEFQKLAKTFNWIDAPHAITEIRNSLVHPEHKRRGHFGEAFYPAWKLGQWYLELAILRICDYSGTYSNRLTAVWEGQVENVPWNHNP